MKVASAEQVSGVGTEGVGGHCLPPILKQGGWSPKIMWLYLHVCIPYLQLQHTIENKNIECSAHPVTLSQHMNECSVWSKMTENVTNVTGNQMLFC